MEAENEALEENISFFEAIICRFDMNFWRCFLWWIFFLEHFGLGELYNPQGNQHIPPWESSKIIFKQTLGGDNVSFQ